MDADAGAHDNQPLQDSYWLDFYEAAWAYRADAIDKMIKDGEHQPLRLIRRLAALESRSTLIHYKSSGVTALVPKLYPGHDESPDGCPSFMTTSLRGKYVRVPFHYGSTPTSDYLSDYIEKNGPYDAIIELGCGYGRNLIELYYGGGPKGINYIGGELTSSGRRLAAILADLDKDFSAQFLKFDHTLPDMSHFPTFKRPLIFTVHSIEQVHKLSLEFFRIVSKAAPDVTCLHFEPFGFQVADLGVVTRRHRELIISKNWNINMASLLKEASASGLIRLHYVATEIFFSRDPLNPTSLAIWSASSRERY